MKTKELILIMKLTICQNATNGISTSEFIGEIYNNKFIFDYFISEGFFVNFTSGVLYIDSTC
jgi:hypothetical protein